MRRERAGRRWYSQCPSAIRRLVTYSSPLVTDSFRGDLRGLRIQVLSALDDGREAGVQVINQRNPGRYVQLRDLGITDPVQVLDQRPKRVPVRNDKHGAAHGE